MSYLYFPGCSLKSTGRAYEESALAVFQALEAPLQELEDWNCCGATAYMAISEMKALALSARNLALAEKHAPQGPVDLVAPCAACYLVLSKTQRYLSEEPELRTKVTGALQDVGLTYEARVRVRHPLDVLVNEIGLEKIKSAVKRSLAGLKVACYYGCQIVRPYADFDDQHFPTSMDRLMKALGAETVNWPLKTRCCGGSLTGTIQEVGLRLSHIILQDAQKRGADAVVTACPLCQFNLECYQDKINTRFEASVKLPVVYFTQLVGVALGIEDQKLSLNRMFIPVAPVVAAKTAQGGQHANV